MPKHQYSVLGLPQGYLKEILSTGFNIQHQHWCWKYPLGKVLDLFQPMTPREFNRSDFKKSAADNIDIEQIGKGGFFTEGDYKGKSGNRGWGLKGQLSKYRRSGWKSGETKNISKKNLADMEKMIAEREKKHFKGYRAQMTRLDKKSIMAEAEKFVRTKGSKFSRQDKKDLKNLVDTIQQKGKEAILHHDPQSTPINTNTEATPDSVNNPTISLINAPGPIKNSLNKAWSFYKKLIGLPNNLTDLPEPINQTVDQHPEIKLPNPDEAKDLPIDNLKEPLPLPANNQSPISNLHPASPIAKTSPVSHKTKSLIKQVPTVSINNPVEHQDDPADLVID